MSDLTKTKVKRFTIQESVDKWIDKRMKHLAIKTIDSNQYSVDYIVMYLGGNLPLESITTKHIESFV